MAHTEMEKLHTKIMYWIGKLLGFLLALIFVVLCVLVLSELIDIVAQVIGEIIEKYGSKVYGH